MFPPPLILTHRCSPVNQPFHIVCSLFGVILIARPPALFGEVHGAMTETMPQPGMMKFNRVPIDNSISGGGGYADPGRGADPAERLRAVAYVSFNSPFLPPSFQALSPERSVVIIGVSMAAGASTFLLSRCVSCC